VPGASRAPAALELALVAEPRRGELIGEVTTRERFAFTRIDRVERLIELGGHYGAIVLWVDGALSSIASLVGTLRGRFAGTPIVVIAAGLERWEVRAALAAGAAGVVHADELEHSLGPCLRAVSVGQTCVPRGHWRQVEPKALSAREKQVLGLVVMGYMNSEIAERLFLAESTVKSHLSSAFGKLGVRSRNEAAELITNPQRGFGLGILELDAGDPAPTTS
jgi:DNA-binding NarL/FixJ family response regulator